MTKLYIMKRFERHILLLAVAIMPFASSAHNHTAQLDSAAACYQAAKFEQAIDIYEGILSQGYESAELYFNLGNAYYKSNKFPYAIANYERALKLNSTDEDVLFNLQLANTHVVDKIDVLPEFFLKSWGLSLVRSLTSNQWAMVSIVSFVVALLLFLLFFLSDRPALRKAAFWVGCLLLVATFFEFRFSGKQSEALLNEPDAIVVTPSVVVKSSPDSMGTELFLIHEGLKVKVTAVQGEWSEIKLSDGNKGWVRTSDYVVI